MALAVSLIILMSIHTLDGDASVSAGRPFDSRLAPTPTAIVPRSSSTPVLVVYPTATPSPGGSLKGATFAYRRYLPIVAVHWYGFKGAGDPTEEGQPKPAMTYLGLGWWWDWTYFGNDASTAGQPYWGPWGNHGGVGPYPSLNQIYAPCLWCPRSTTLDAQVRAEAQRYPSRVWLLFNEPDSWAQCGASMGTNTITRAQNTAMWYDHFWEIIKGVDPTAKVFCCGNYYLPMPGLSDTVNMDGIDAIYARRSDTIFFPEPNLAGAPADGRVFWETFIASANLNSHPLDGLHIHVYPGELGTMHDGCPVAWPEWHGGSHEYVHYWAEWNCAEEALAVAYSWFQTQPALANRPIWIGETGSLDYTGDLTQAYVLVHNMDPLQSSMASNASANGSRKWVNAVAWFATYSWAHPSDLLAASKEQPSTLGNDWAVWSCPGCELPR